MPAGWCSTSWPPATQPGSRCCCCTGFRRPPPAGPSWPRRLPTPGTGCSLPTSGGTRRGRGRRLSVTTGCRSWLPMSWLWANPPGGGRFHVVGHDWGGAVAWHLAARHPERVATLTAVSTPHPRALAAALRSSAQPLRSAYIALFRTPRLPELALGARGLAGLRLLLARSGLSNEWAAAYAGALAEPGALAAALAWYRAAGSSTLRAPAVAVPTCHLWGSGDPALG